MNSTIPFKTSLWLVVPALALCTLPSNAQVPPAEPDPSRVRVRFGPLLIDPTIALTNLGVDTNVFNTAKSDNPQSDVTMTLTPRADVSLRIGRSRVIGSIKEDLIWYKRFASERAVNNSYLLALHVPLTRVTFSGGGDWVHVRERPGFEIDARSQRSERGINGNAEVRLVSRTHVGVRGTWRKIEFEKDAIFLGASLRDELTRTQTSGALSIRHTLTPLTSVSLDVTRSQDRFDFAPLRDSNSTGVGVNVQFDARALITGSAKIGIRHFQPLSPGVPRFRGSTATVDLSSVAFGSTRVGIQVSRDIQYSFDLNHPYYLQTGFTGSVAQHIFGPVDIEGRAGAQRLGYRSRQGVGVTLLNPTDRVRTYGGSIGYRMGRDVRVGFSVEKQSRVAGVNGRNYDGLRFGTAVTYAH